VVAGQWQELRLEVSGDRLRGFLNGQLVVEATDSTYRAGRVGLWTKADSVTCFDDVVVTPVTKWFAALIVAGRGRCVCIIGAGCEHDVTDQGASAAPATARRQQRPRPMTRPATPSRSPSPDEGLYRYYCIPHEGDGMTGQVDVG